MKRGAALMSLLLVTLLGWMFWSSGDAPAQAYPYDDLVRFHVIANSDTNADQALKRDVRDKVLQEFSVVLAQAKTVDQAVALIKDNLAAIENTAQREVLRQGYNYPVRAVLGQFPFPIKSYGSVTLPAGDYQALRLIIGQGRGENWWCILFPPLCFVDVSGDGEKLPANVLPTLTGQQYNGGIKIKLKVLELLQGSPHLVGKAELETNDR